MKPQVVLSAFLLVALTIVFSLFPKDEVARAGVPDLLQAPRSVEENEIIKVYKAYNEAVVFITTITLTIDPLDFFSEVQPKEGTGSGIIVDSEKGIILTSLHAN